jgi:hypothetical protein
MKLVTIPQNITVKNGAESAEIGFVETMIRNTWTADPKYGATATLICEAADLLTLFDGKSPGDVVPLPDAMHATLRGIVEAPSQAYNPGLVIQLVPFLRAILDAPAGAK